MSYISICNKNCLTGTESSYFYTIALLLSCVCVDNVSLLLSQNYSSSNYFAFLQVR